MPDAKLSALTEVSVPALTDLLYLVDVSDTTDDAAGSSRRATLDRLLGLVVGVPGGRLTTESGVAVSTSDRTAQSTLYYTPYLHDRIGLYDGTRWRLHTFTERSLALSGLTSGRNYDVFLFDNSGTLTLELTIWTNDTTRGTALTTQDGVLVRSGATTRRYLGTIRTTGTTTTEDSTASRFIWNLYNREPRNNSSSDTTSHTYTTGANREWNNGSGVVRAQFLAGVAGLGVSAGYFGYMTRASAGTAGACGVALNSTTVGLGTDTLAAAALVDVRGGAAVQGQAGLGLNYLTAIQFGLSGVTYQKISWGHVWPC